MFKSPARDLLFLSLFLGCTASSLSPQNLAQGLPGTGWAPSKCLLGGWAIEGGRRRIFENKGTCVRRIPTGVRAGHPHAHTQGSVIHSSQEVEATNAGACGQKNDKQNAVNTGSGIFFNLKREKPCKGENG